MKKKHLNLDFTQAISRNALAYIIGISYSTFYRKLKKSDIDLPPGLIYPPNVERVYLYFCKYNSLPRRA